MTWAVTWPIAPFTLRLQGGQDSEFGNYAIGGLEWQHPTRRLAVGLGLPVNLHNARGGFGGVLQFRMQFD